MADSSNRDPMVRCVVTGHDANGVVWIDGFATNHRYPSQSRISTLLWSTEGSPADFMLDKDAGARLLGTAPPPQGTRFMFSELQPNEKIDNLFLKYYLLSPMVRSYI